MGVLGGPIVDIGVLGGAMADIGVLGGAMADIGVLGGLRDVPGVMLSIELAALHCRAGVWLLEEAAGEVNTECILERLCNRLADRVVSFNYNMQVSWTDGRKREER